MSTPSTDRPRIVVGVDGSAHSEEALRWAARLARAEGATIDVVAVWDLPATSYAWGAVAGGYVVPEQMPEEQLRDFTNSVVDSVLGEDRPETTVTLIAANPAQALLDRSEGALMVVVGSRGRGGFTGLLLGSVSQTVSSHAKVPVLVVHAPENQA